MFLKNAKGGTDFMNFPIAFYGWIGDVLLADRRHHGTQLWRNNGEHRLGVEISLEEGGADIANSIATQSRQ
jgi:hypothetical protein